MKLAALSPCLDIRLTPKQSNIYAWGWQPEARFRDAVCGRRFGKTFLGVKELQRACQLAVRWQVSVEDEIWYAAPTFKQGKRVFWRRLKRAIPGDWLAGRPSESECCLTLKSGHVLRIVGLDQYDHLRGSGLFFVLVDEWADCPYAAWTEVLRPMLSTCRYVVDGVPRQGGHALRIGTPKGFNHCYDSFCAGQGGVAEHRSWLYTSLAGGNVPAAELAAARRDLDARTFRQEYEASFENFCGRVYFGFQRAHNVKVCAFDAALPVHVGMDFNVNPMSAAVFQERPDGEIWQVDEVVLPVSDTGAMAEELARRFGRPALDGGRPEVGHVTVYPDPAGAQRRSSALGKTDIGILRSFGFNVVAMSRHPLVRDRVNVVNGKLESAAGRRLLFLDPRCRQSIGCFERLTYREGSSEPDKRLGLDHLPDATGYYLFTRFAYSAPHGQHIDYMGR